MSESLDSLLGVGETGGEMEDMLEKTNLRDLLSFLSF